MKIILSTLIVLRLFVQLKYIDSPNNLFAIISRNVMFAFYYQNLQRYHKLRFFHEGTEIKAN